MHAWPVPGWHARITAVHVLPANTVRQCPGSLGVFLAQACNKRVLSGRTLAASSLTCSRLLLAGGDMWFDTLVSQVTAPAGGSVWGAPRGPAGAGPATAAALPGGRQRECVWRRSHAAPARCTHRRGAAAADAGGCATAAHGGAGASCQGEAGCQRHQCGVIAFAEDRLQPMQLATLQQRIAWQEPAAEVSESSAINGVC